VQNLEQHLIWDRSRPFKKVIYDWNFKNACEISMIFTKNPGWWSCVVLLMLNVKDGDILDFVYAWQVKILVDEEHENEETGAGELCVKSPSSFKEYWKLPEVLAEC